jgi:Cdc6-like AAA superfamily ATPase
MPGAGKTMLTSLVIDHLSTQPLTDTTSGIAYVYCNYGRHHEQKAVDLLLNLLRQLVQGGPSMPEKVKELYDLHMTKRTRPSIGEISKTLRSVIISYARTFIVIEALDECQISDGNRKKLLLELFRIQTETGANLFATSRFIPEIESEFEGKIILEIRANDEDVRRYINGRMSQLPSFVSRNDVLEEEIRSKITEAVGGMYEPLILSEHDMH